MNQPATSNNAQLHIQQSDLEQLFAGLDVQQVEQFYQLYRTWQQQSHVDQLIHEIETLRWQIAENDVLLRQAQPSTMVQADIALLETRGVVDIDLLDRMVGRGEIWLNRTIDQLQHCEKLNMIGESYESWCEHALEGAYEWISTMEENDPTDENTNTAEHSRENYDTGTTLIEDAFLKKLMSEENELSDQNDQNQPDVDNTNTESTASMADEEALDDIEAQSPEDLEIVAQQVADFEQNLPENSTEGVISDAPDDQAIDIPVQAEDAPPVDASTHDDTPPTTDTPPSDITDTVEAPDTQTQQDNTQINTDNLNADAGKKEDRHWPYILDTEETNDDEDDAQSSSPAQKSTESDIVNTQAQQEDEHQEQEPQSLVQKLLTRVLRR